MMNRGKGMPYPTLEWLRAQSNVDLTSGCWVWNRAQDGKGYGATTDGGKVRKAYAVAYERKNGAVAGGLQLDHLCRNRLCINPDHLEAVTSAENTRRGNARQRRAESQKSKMTCPKGHSYEGENLYMMPSGSRGCKACRNIAVKKYQSRRYTLKE